MIVIDLAHRSKKQDALLSKKLAADVAAWDAESDQWRRDYRQRDDEREALGHESNLLEYSSLAEQREAIFNALIGLLRDGAALAERGVELSERIRAELHPLVRKSRAARDEALEAAGAKLTKAGFLAENLPEWRWSRPQARQLIAQLSRADSAFAAAESEHKTIARQQTAAVSWGTTLRGCRNEFYKRQRHLAAQMLPGLATV